MEVRSAKKRMLVQKILIYAVLAVLSLFFMIPLYNMVAKSLMTVQIHIPSADVVPFGISVG